MQNNIVICIIILAAIALIAIGWTFFSRRRKEFKRALLVTHRANQGPRQVTIGDLESVTLSSEATPSSSTSSGEIEPGYRKTGKGRGRDKRKEKRKDREKALEMTSRRINERLAEKPQDVTARNESVEQRRDRIDGPLENNRKPGGSEPCPSDKPMEGGWSSNVDAGNSSNSPQGDWGRTENTSTESQGGWGGGNGTNGGAFSGW